MADNQEILPNDELRIPITGVPPVEGEYSIPGEGGGEVDYVLPQSDKDKGNEFSSKTQSAYSAAISADRGEEPVPVYQQLEGLPPDVLTQQTRDEYLRQLDAGIQSVIQSSLENQTPDEFTEGLDATASYYTEARDRAGSNTIPERALVEQVSRLYGPDADEVEKKIINQMYFRRRMGEILKNQGYDDWASNIAGLLLLSDESSDTGRTVTGSGLFDPDIVETWFSSAENWQKFVSAFSQMSAEEQVQDFEAILEVMKDTTDDNALKIAGQLSELIDPTGADNAQVWHTLDKMFLAGTVVGFARAASRTLRGANLIRTMEQLDNVDLAADTTRLAAQDSKAAAAAGVTRAEAAAKIVPFDNTVLLDGAPSRVAHAVVEKQDLLTEYTKINTDLANKFVTPQEAQAQAAAAADNLSKTPNIQDVKVTSVDETGFTLSYEVVSPGPDSAEVLKRWFDGSKVVDSKGQPLKVYHGTGADFDSFDTKGLGSHFTQDPAVANKFAADHPDGGRVVPVYLNIKNPLRISDHGGSHTDAKGVAEALIKEGVLPKDYIDDQFYIRLLGDAFGDDEKFVANNIEEISRIKAAIEAKGYDGIVYKNAGEGGGDSWIAFHPEQIRSAIGNLDFPPGAPVSRGSTFTKKFTIDDFTGEYVDEDMGILKATTRGIWGPNFLFQNNRKALVNEPERLFRESAHAALRFKEAQRQIFKGLSKASVQKVNAVLARGRDNERVYSYAELVGNDILTKQEFEAYALTRHLFDIAYRYENSMTRNKLLAKGIKEVDINGVKELLRPAEDVVSAKAMFRSHTGGKIVYIPEAVEGDMTYGKLTGALIDKYYNLGYTLARGDAGKYITSGGGKYSDFVLVKNGAVKDLPETVISFRPGYAPISYKNGTYFVKTAIRGIVGNEAKIVELKTHRYFDNLTDATTFAEELKVKGYKNGAGVQVAPKAEDVQIMHNRQMAQEAFEEDRVRIFGGLYNSARAGERIKFGLDGADPDLVDPLIAMTDYFDHVAKNYPMHLFRMQMEQTWMNTARARWGLPHTYKGTFKDAVKHISDGLSTTERAFAQKSHMQTMLQMNIPTTEERAIRTWTRDFAERLEVGPGLKGARKAAAKVLHKADSRDPVNAVLGAGFNLVLGMWNFSTMVVQGLGSTIAMTIHPLRAPLHMSSALALAAMDNFADPTVLNLARRRIGSKFKDVFPDEGYIADLHKSWSMSGLRETVMSGNPEYQALKKNLPYDRTLLKKALDTHTMFYGIGEGFNFRYAWGAAFDWWKMQKGNAARKVDQKAVDEIRARADTYLLHMNRVNKSTVQTGAWRIPTQFTTIFFRYAEALMGKELTVAEKTRMVVGQSILFGIAGVPFATTVANYAMEKTGTTPSEDQKDVIRSGLLQKFVQDYLGINVEIAGRASIMKGIYDEASQVIFGGASIGEVALGASGGIVGSRALDTVHRLYNLGRLDTSLPHPEDLPKDIHAAVVDAILDNANSWRSLTAAREVVVNKMFKDRRGGVIATVGDDEINFQTKVAMALGLRYDKLDKLYIASMASLDDKKRVQEKAGTIIKTIDAILSESKTGADTEKGRLVVNLVTSSILENETEEFRRKVREVVINKVIDPTTSEDRIRRQQLEQVIREGVLSDTMTPSFIGDIK